MVCGDLPHFPHGPLSPGLCPGQQSLVAVLTRCGLPLPVYILADEKHSRCLTEKVYLPTIVSGRVIWHLGYSESKSAAAFTESYGAFQRAALQQEPSYQVRGCPHRWLRQHHQQYADPVSRGAPGFLPAPRAQQAPRQADRPRRRRCARVCARKFHTLLHRCRQRTSLRVVALGQRLRRFADHIATTVGHDHGERVRRWFQAKKAGWYTVLADPQMPAMSTVLDQAHNAIDRKLFMMKGFHHPGGSQPAFLTGLAHLYNLIPYQRRALHAGQCGVEVEGGRLPTHDWMLNLQILTSGGFR